MPRGKGPELRAPRSREQAARAASGHRPRARGGSELLSRLQSGVATAPVPGVPGAWGGASQTGTRDRSGTVCPLRTPPPVEAKVAAAAGAGPSPRGRRTRATGARRPGSLHHRCPVPTHLPSRRWPPGRRPEVHPRPAPPGRAHFRDALGAGRTTASVISWGGGRGTAVGGEFLNPCGAGWRPVDLVRCRVGLPHKYLWPLITGARSLSRSVARGSSAELSVPGCTRFQSSARLAGMAHTYSTSTVLIATGMLPSARRKVPPKASSGVFLSLAWTAIIC